MIYELGVFTLFMLIATFASAFFIQSFISYTTDTDIEETAGEYKERVHSRIKRYQNMMLINNTFIWVVYCIYLMVALWSFDTISIPFIGGFGIMSIAVLSILYYRRKYGSN